MLVGPVEQVLSFLLGELILLKSLSRFVIDGVSILFYFMNIIYFNEFYFNYFICFLFIISI